MNDEQARRVLGLPADADAAAVRRAFAAQVRVFREARAATDDPDRQARLDRALDAFLAARRQLVRSETQSFATRSIATRSIATRSNATRSFATTQELPPLELLVDRRFVVLLGAGLLLLALGLLLPSGETPAPEPVARRIELPALDLPAPAAEDDRTSVGTDASGGRSEPQAGQPTAASSSRREPQRQTQTQPGSAAVAASGPQRAWLDPLRSALASAWRTDDGWTLPATTVLPADASAPDALPAGWRVQPQRRGGVALVDGSDGSDGWLLAMPALRGGRLLWACLASTALAGCVDASGVRGLAADVVAGTADDVAVGDALRALPGVRTGGLDAAGWYRQALDRGNGRGGERLAALALAGANGTAAALAAWREALDAFAAADDRAGQLRVLEPLARASALDPGIAPEATAKLLLRCRALRKSANDDAARCPTPGEIGQAIEAGAGDEQAWRRARWWYENAVAEREASGVRGLARILATGHTGKADRDQALALIEDAAKRWDRFSGADAAATAGGISDLFVHGWGVAPDAGQGAWWASQAARLGNVGAALRLAGDFVLGVGTDRDMQRARGLVKLYSDVAPLFEVAFYRSVGQRLAAGEGVEPDPDAAAAWLRRAFTLCSRLAGDGNDDARMELAGMYFAGDGVDQDARRAAAMYGELLDHAPVKAGNMLAWIRATWPDPALRDGASAVKLARAVVAKAPQADYYDTLAAALAEQGDFAAARAAELRALSLLDAEADPGLGGRDVAARRAEMNARLQAFRDDRPWRDSGQEVRRT